VAQRRDAACLKGCLGAKLLAPYRCTLQGYFGQITYFLYPSNQKIDIIIAAVPIGKDAHLKGIQQQS
jgi:hypothetical protein